MTDIQLKKRFKKLIPVLIILVLCILALAVYILGSNKAELSIYTNAESENKMQALGINEDEFKQYLSIAGYMLGDSNEEKLKLATDFIDTLCSAYEAEVSENGTQNYDKDMINHVLEEVTGNYIKEEIGQNEYYTYNEQTNVYTKIKQFEENPCCIEIEDISKSDDKIEVVYQLAMMNSEQMAEYMTNQNMEIQTKKIKAVIICNSDYEYSKYFVSTVEEVNG